MVVIDLERPAPPMPASTPPLQEPSREGRTLEDVLSGAWEDLTAHRTGTCPICGGAMLPRYGSGPSPVGGRCGECGTQLE